MTDAIYREVKSSMARYTDMPSILQSMKDKGTLDILSQCLNDIFRSEIDFANKRLKSLVNVMIKDGKQVDLQEQITRNINIFKSNFDIILTLLVSKAWQSATSSTQGRQQTLPLSIPTDLALSYNIKSSTLISPTSIRQSSIQRHTMTQQSFISKFSKSSPSPSLISKSKMENINMSVSSLKSYNSKNGGPVPFSEISYISGSPTTFNRAVRNLDQSLTTVSPGVGRYEKVAQGEKVIRQSTPSVMIDRAPKISWIDEKLKKEGSQSPGPKYDVSKHFCSSRPSSKK